MDRVLLRRLTRNKSLVVGSCLLLFLCLVALVGPVLIRPGGDRGDISHRLEPPSKESPLGKDQLGRDVLSRVVLGAKTSLASGAVVVLLSGLLGGIVGVVSGYFGRATDSILMRCVDFLLAFPTFLLAMAVVAILGPGLRNAILALVISYTGPFARLVRGVTIRVKANEYMEAAHSIGASDLHIVARHVLPNILAPVTVQLALSFGGAIVDLAGLSFLGLGAQPPFPEWGAMLSAGRPYIATAWWMTTYPGLCIMMSVLAFIFVGDGLRDVMDPRR